MLYLPRLYVYHAMCEDEIGNERFKVMERKLYYGIMTPGGILTIVFGTWLWLGYGFAGSWLMWKLILVIVLVVYHIWCGVALRTFRDDKNTRSHTYYRIMNEAPLLALIPIVFLVVLKPSF